MTEAAELPPAPEQAHTVFGERLADAVRYAELLADVGVRRGLIGPREVPRLWERHLLNCAVLSDTVPDGVSVCDVGCGNSPKEAVAQAQSRCQEKQQHSCPVTATVPIPGP